MKIKNMAISLKTAINKFAPSLTKKINKKQWDKLTKNL